MKIKTSELTGLSLDWAVEVAKGSSVYMRHDFMRQRHQYLRSSANLEWHLQRQKNEPIVGDLVTGGTKFLPNNSTNWAQAGPIIEREEIGIRVNRPCSKGREWEAAPSITAKGAGGKYGYGPTPLIAAMRCYVASKIGDEVDVPEDLS